MTYPKLKDYRSLSLVPLDHPEVPYKCMMPIIICPKACGDFGCLNEKEDCEYMTKKEAN